MAEIRIERVLRRPLITEKNTRLIEENNQYSFEVDPQANKPQIRDAVEKTFNVRVKAVNTLNVKPKPKSRYASRRGGRITGAKPGWKKAIVTLYPGQRIDIFEQV